jgi:serine/threonine protein kinase
MKMHEVFETNNSLYIVLELLEGGSLFEELKNNILLSSKQIKTILFGILKGLKHIHSKNIMHRDLKLENILFRE